MGIHVTNYPGAAYFNTQAGRTQPGEKGDISTPANPQDAVSISPEARAALAKQAVRADSTDTASAVSEEQDDTTPVTAFPSFAVEFDQVTQRYTDAVREHYSKAHEENLTYADPSVHIWNKYKNPESPDFRSDLSDDERAWAYDHEHDMLRGGKHFQLGNPFVFENPPTLSSAAMEANAACRAGMDEAIQYIFKQEGIKVPDGASFRLTVDSDYTIHVSGLEDKELAASIEQTLNSGDNGKHLYEHLKITSPDGESLGVNFSNGHLETLDSQPALSEDALAEIKRQVGPSCFHYSSAYNPHQGPLGVMALPGTPEPTPAERESSYALVRLGAPEMLARDRAGEFYHLPLELNIKYQGIEHVDTVARDLYSDFYLQQTMNTQKTIEDYYAAAHRENSSYPFEEGVQHIKDKYQNQDSAIFRFDLPPAQRAMYFRQEMALLTGSLLSLRDPYALASSGGVLSAEEMHDKAMQAVLEKLDQMLKDVKDL